MFARRFLRTIPQRSFGLIPAVEASTAVSFKSSASSNGIQMVSKDAHANLVSLKFAVLGGSAAEAAEEKGAAHMLSVAAFAGTANKTGLRLMRELEDIGATVSASADREKITLDVTVLSGVAELAFERMAETISSAPRNKYVILDCLGAAQVTYDSITKSPKKVVVELLHEAAFGEASPMGGSFLADHGDLHNLTAEAVLKYRQHQFTSNNLVIASSGISHDLLKGYTEKYLSTLASGAAANTASPYVGGEARQKLNVRGHTYTALAFPVPNAGLAAKPYNVLRAMLSQKLVKHTHEHSATENVNGMGGEASAFYAPYAGHGGLWGIYTNGSSPTVANAHLEHAIAELKTVANNVNAADFEAAKNNLTVQQTAELESDCSTSSLLKSFLANVSPSDYVNYSAISAGDVSRAAKASLEAVPSYVVVGKTAGAHSFATVNSLLK